MSMGNVEAFRAAVAKNPQIEAEVYKAKSWEDIVGVAQKYGFKTSVTAHLAFYRTQPKSLSPFEVKLFGGGGFPWCA